MPRVPDSPKIFHITHVQNLSGIVRDGVLWSDAKRIEAAPDTQVVGMKVIKARRLTELPVKCHPGTKVGEYVPFYLCPRSVMLYILHMGNHPELTYHGGQGPMVHIVADLRATVAWAAAQGRRWAITSSNAGARYTPFYSDLGDLDKINWEAVEARDFREAEIKDGKQAEFLLHQSLPWELVEAIGVRDAAVADQAHAALCGADHHPDVRVERAWYY